MKLTVKIETLKRNMTTIQQLISKNKTINQEVTLIAVTKYVDSDTIRKLYELGIRHFGENRSEELLKKQSDLADISDDIVWHFIGQLQRRPVRKMINQISYLHSLDRLSLIKEVNKRANSPIDSFLQVNISGEEQKTGFEAGEIMDVIKNLVDYPNVRIVGLMTMAPYGASSEQLHQIFGRLKQLQEQIKEMNLVNAPCTDLSMGMSNDFEIAIQEGATMVRIGTALYQES